MNNSLTIFRMWGVPLKFHISLLLIPVFILLGGFPQNIDFNWSKLAFFLGYSALLMISVLIHEYSHVFMAKRLGGKTYFIVLFILGAGAYIDMPQNHRKRIWIYLAGPISNLLLALLAFLALYSQEQDVDWLFHTLTMLSHGIVVPLDTIQEIALFTLLCNLLLGASNLIPAYPLDGGQILVSLSTPYLGERKALLLGVVSGIIFSLILFGLAYSYGDFLIALFGCFFLFQSMSAWLSGWQQRKLAKLSVKDFIRTPPTQDQRLYLNDSLTKAREHLLKSTSPASPVYNNWNEIVGIVEKSFLYEKPIQEGVLFDQTVQGYSIVTENQGSIEVIQKMYHDHTIGARVFSEQGVYLGFVYAADISKVIQPAYRRIFSRLNS